MPTRRFSGPTILDAVRAARRALGPDALVLSVRERRSGWLRSRPIGVEIRARAGDPTPVVPGVAAGVALADALAPMLRDLERLAEEVGELRRVVEVLERRADPAPPLRPRTGRARGPLHRPESTPRSVEAWNRD